MFRFKDFVLLKEEAYKKDFIQLEKGFVPPTKMRPVVRAFLNSNNIILIKDTSKEIKMPKKSLYLTGGTVRDFLKGKTIRDYHLVTNATPEQIALILHKAGFSFSGGNADKLKLTFTPKTDSYARRIWEIGKSDHEGKPFSIVATVNDEEFEICTLHKGNKGKIDKVEFTDDLEEDAKGRDLHFNALYIELTKEDGENNRLYDPTGEGYHDLKNDQVRINGKAKDRLEKDPSTLLRAVRLQARYGKTDKLDSEIEDALKDFNIDDLDSENIRQEFLKGLTSPEVNVKTLINLYDKIGLNRKLFPGLKINTDIPEQFSSKADKPLALAWILHGNPIEQVAEVIAESSWNSQERRAILFLIALLEFSPEKRPDFLEAWKGTGLSKKQIKDWVELFNYVDQKGQIKNKRPVWAVHVKTFANYDCPLAREDEITGFPKILIPNILRQLETERFMDKLPKTEGFPRENI